MTKKEQNTENYFDDKLLDELISDCKTEADLFGGKGVVKQFVKRLAERALKGEIAGLLEQNLCINCDIMI